MKRSIAIAACALLLLGAVPKPDVRASGGTTLILQPDASVSLIGISYFIRAGLDRQQPRENGLAALTAESILRTPVQNEGALEDAVAASGGSISMSIEDGDAEFYIEGAADRVPQLLALFETALAKPDFSAAVVNDARTRLVRAIASNQEVALQVGVEMLGSSQLGNAVSLARFAPSDVQSFYGRAYRRTGVIVSAIGRLDAVPASAFDTLAAILPPGSSKPAAAKAALPPAASRQIIAQRDVSAPWLVAQYGAAKPGSRDFGAMLVLSAVVNRALADVTNVPNTISHSFADRSAGTIYDFSSRPSDLIVYVDGGSGDPSRTFGTALAVISVIASSKLQGSLSEYKAAAEGQFIDDAASLHDRSWLAGSFAEQGASTDYLNATLAQIAAVTPADLQRAARTYMGNPTVALVLPRSN